MIVGTTLSVHDNPMNTLQPLDLTHIARFYVLCCFVRLWVVPYNASLSYVLYVNCFCVSCCFVRLWVVPYNNSLYLFFLFLSRYNFLFGDISNLIFSFKKQKSTLKFGLFNFDQIITVALTTWSCTNCESRKSELRRKKNTLIQI